MKIFESCIRFLDECNFFATSIPLCTLQTPEQVVEHGIMHPEVCAGISIGHTRIYVPDVLLGYIDDQHRWHWADQEHACALNLHTCRQRVETPPGALWPVWLTITDCRARERLQTVQPRIDLLRILQRDKARQFWEESLEEFIRVTWHPSRLHWCLDTDDHGFFYSSDEDPETISTHLSCARKQPSKTWKIT